MNVKELLKKCQRDRTAVLATNFYNFETLTAVMQAAQRMQAPVLLQLTRSSIDYMGLEQAVGMGRRAMGGFISTTADRSNWSSGVSMQDSTR
mgnify:CR=1 FL=1